MEIPVRVDLEMQLRQIELHMRDYAAKHDPDDRTSIRVLADWVADLAEQAVNPR